VVTCPLLPRSTVRAPCVERLWSALSDNLDPLFFVHHAQIDRLWWKWQILNRDSRLRDYDSIERDLGNGTFGKLSVSLQDPLLMGGLGVDVEVKDVMSIEADLLCYKYPSV
jgi:tyrosinase